jgi:hypothetical protein
MATTLCPNGHASTTSDYCDTCGAPIGGSPSSAAPAAPPVQSAPPDPAAAAAPGGPSAQSAQNVTCAHCGAQNPADALFCEVCGYDFTTGQAPPPETPRPVVTHASAPTVAPAPAPTSGWAVEISADAGWYASKATGDTDPFPVNATARLVALTGHVALIGRESASRGIHPEIDAGADSAVSRRHAQLVRTGHSWQVVDLQSTNGTYVGRAGLAPPDDPLPSGQPVDLAPGDSVFVGAWTRINLRNLDEPAAAGPEAEAPATEGPTTEAPAAEAPATEAPAAEAPTTEAPAGEGSSAPPSAPDPV